MGTLVTAKRALPKENQPFSSTWPPSAPSDAQSFFWKPINDRFSDKERRGYFWDRREIIDRRAARRPGQLSVHSHGWELFSSDTSSYTHAYPIDFINPDSHLLDKRSMLNVYLCSIELTGLLIMFNFFKIGHRCLFHLHETRTTRCYLGYSIEIYVEILANFRHNIY